MRYYFFLPVLILLFLGGCADKTAKAQSKFIKIAPSVYSVDKSIAIVASALKSKNYHVTSIFNHEKEALALKQMLYPTKTLNLYNSKIATKMIRCKASTSLEFPLRIAFYSKIDGKVYFAYTDPEYWSLKHNIKDSECLKLLILIKSDIAQATSALAKKR